MKSTTMPAVSVVIPAYNAAATLSQTLASLLDQTFGDYEAIIVDDGSTDSTSSLPDEFGDDRLQVLSIENGGVANARNRGLTAARGQLIAFLDADDLWLPTKLEQQLSGLQAQPAAEMCVTAATRIDGRGEPLATMPLRHDADPCAALLLGSMVLGCVSSGLFRRSALERVGGFNPKFSQCADWDLWLRVSAQSAIVLIDEPLVQYRSAPGNMSSNVELLERDTFAVLDDFFSSPQADGYASLRRRVYATHWMICAGSYLEAGRRGAAVRCLWEALRSDPRTIDRPLGLPVRRLKRARHRRRQRAGQATRL